MIGDTESCKKVLQAGFDSVAQHSRRSLAQPVPAAVPSAALPPKSFDQQFIDHKPIIKTQTEYAQRIRALILALETDPVLCICALVISFTLTEIMLRILVRAWKPMAYRCNTRPSRRYPGSIETLLLWIFVFYGFEPFFAGRVLLVVAVQSFPDGYFLHVVTALIAALLGMYIYDQDHNLGKIGSIAFAHRIYQLLSLTTTWQDCVDQLVDKCNFRYHLLKEKNSSVETALHTA